MSWLPRNWGYSSLWQPKASPDPFWEAPRSSPIWKSPSSYPIYNPSEHWDLAMNSRGSCCELKKSTPLPCGSQGLGYLPTSPLSFLGPPLLFSRPHSQWLDSSPLWHACSLSKTLLVFLPPPARFLFCFSSTYLILEHVKPGIHLCSSWACGKVQRSLPREISAKVDYVYEKDKVKLKWS